MSEYITQISVLTSSWADTHFPTVREMMRVSDITETIGSSGAMYFPTYVSGGALSVLMEAQYSDGSPVFISSCVLTSSAPGDIYNIGGISGESTKNIVFTLWENTGYGRGAD